MAEFIFGTRSESNQPTASTRLTECLNPTSETLPHRPRVHPEKHRLTQEPPAHPVPRPTPAPFRPANTPPPLRGKRKRKKPLEALRAAQPLRPGARRPPAAPCNPLAVSATVNAPVPATVPGPPPFFLLRRLSELGIPIPAPAPSARRLPFATAPLVGAAPSRPQRPLALRHLLPPVSLAPLVPASRARHPSSGCLPPPPAFRSTDPPPPASSYERPLTLSARTAPTGHREKASRQRTQ